MQATSARTQRYTFSESFYAVRTRTHFLDTYGVSKPVRRGFFFLCGFGESWWSDTAIAGHGVWFQIHFCLYIFVIF
jgi:hypothetical protein